MEVRKEDQRDQDEKVVEIEIERLRDFKNHPFKVQADSQMKELQESIRKCSQVDYLTGKKSVEVISEECGDSPKQVQRYLKLGLLRQIGIYRKCDKKAKTVYWEKRLRKE